MKSPLPTELKDYNRRATRKKPKEKKNRAVIILIAAKRFFITNAIRSEVVPKYARRKMARSGRMNIKL